VYLIIIPKKSKMTKMSLRPFWHSTVDIQHASSYGMLPTMI